MSINVVTFCTYRTSGSPWRKADHDAHDFVQALKGRTIREYSWLEVRGAWHRFDNTTGPQVITWFAQMAADYLRRTRLTQPFSIVPIPSSRTDVRADNRHPTMRMARAVASELGDPTLAEDVLRFDAPMQPAHDGGSRSARILYERLCIPRKPSRRQVVLIDDTLVTGAHIRAAEARLRSVSAEVSLAICAGGAERAIVPNPFALRVRVLNDLTPFRTSDTTGGLRLQSLIDGDVAQSETGAMRRRERGGS